MGSGIAQVAAQNGHETILVDVNPKMLTKAETDLDKILSRLVEKEKISTIDKGDIQGRISYSSDLADFKGCGLVIEAIVEDLTVKHKVFSALEEVVDTKCILASNT